MFLPADDDAIVFPEIIEGDITVMGFIYTHCPDICPMTIHNMQLIEDQLTEQGINNVKFIALSFDPERDTPEVLNQFAELRELDLNSWILLTGEKNIISDLMRRFDVKAVKTDESTDENGKPEYSMMHTDRISLIDSKTRLRKNYIGSTISFEEIIKDIKTLEDLQ